MIRRTLTSRGWTLVGLATALAAAVIGFRAPALALINESPSLPRGLYVRAPGDDIRRQAIVALPQPPRARDYLSSLGMPAEVLLIKRVAAEEGDWVCRTADGLEVAGRRVPTREQDARGRSLPTWSGCGRLAEGQVFLLGDTPSSFDSRYFGPVSGAELTGVYREVLTW